MTYNPVSFNKVTLNISNPQGEKLSWKPGEILSGMVQNIGDDGVVTLYIQGRLITAASEIMVKPGQQLYLLVDGFKDGRTYLKVVTPQMLETIENNNVSSGLKDLGIKASPDNIQLARKLLEFDLPLTTSNLNDLAQAVKILGGATSSNLEVGAFALSRQMNLSYQVLTALKQVTSTTGSDVQKLFSDLLLLLNSTAEKESVVLATDSPVAAGGEEDVKPGPTEPSLMSQFVLGADSSFEIDGKGEQLKQNQLSPMSRPEEKKVIILARQLLEAISLKDGTEPGISALRLAELVKSAPDLIKSSQLLAHIAKNEESGSRSLPVKELASLLEGIGREMTGEQLFNAASRLPGENIINGYYFSFPVQVNNQLHLCQLKIKHDDNKRPLSDVDDIRLVISLDTNNLGMVLFHVEWKRSGELRLQGVVENDATSNYLNNHIDGLTGKLKEMGYRVAMLGIKVAQRAEIFNLRPQLKENPEKAVKTFSIDVTI